MQMRTKPSDDSVLPTYTRVVGVLCLVVGALVILGWWSDIDFLKSVVPGFVTMKVNTALCFILAGGALWLLYRLPPERPLPWIAQISAGLVCSIGFLTLLEYLFNLNLGLDELLLRQSSDAAVTTPSGRMALATAVSFFLVGSALLLIGLEKKWSVWAAQILVLVAFHIPLIVFIGYFYSIEPLYTVAAYSSMALHTALMLLLLCLGVLFVRPTQGLMPIFTSSRPGGVMARRLMPMVILGPIMLGWVRLVGQRAGLYDTVFGLVFMVVACIVTFVSVLWIVARSVNQLVNEREQAEQSRRESEERLRLAMEAALIGTWDRDLTSNKLFWSASQERLMGFAPGTFPGTYEAFASLIHPNDRNVLADAQKFARQNGGHYQAELRFILPDGRERWGLVYGQLIANEQGEPVRVAGVDFDITERKRTEEALRASEEKFRTLIEQASDAFFVHDMQGRFLEVNQRACESLGYTQAELLALNVFDVEQHFEREAAQKVWAQVKVGQAATLYGHQRRRDGTIFPVEVRWSCFDFQGQRLILDLVRDITERQQMEVAIRHSEAHFRVIFEGAGVGNVECDAATGQFVLVNQKMCEIVGYSAAELLTMNFRDITHLDDRESSFERYQQFIRGELPHYFVEKRYVRKDGLIVWVQIHSTLLLDADGQPWRTVAVIQDITKRREAEELLKHSEQRFRELIESLPQFIWTCTGDGLCDYLSPQWIKYTGIPAHQQLGFGWLEQVHPDDLENLNAKWQAAVKAADILDTEFRLRRFDGTYCWFRTRAVPIYDEAGQPLRWFGNNIDIENLKQAEMRIRQLNTDLEIRVAERTRELATANRELEAFAYSVSHDLRAPLRAIDGFSRILVEEYTPQLPPEALEYLQLVRDNTQKMGHLIDDLLNLSRITRQPLQKQSVVLGELTRQVLTELEPEQSGRRVDITIGEMPPCLADPALLKQVLVNLLSNALKFTNRRTVATIEVGCLNATCDTDHPIYFVKDNGAGFNMKYVHKLFDVFQRLHRMEDYEGTGVGLAIVQRILNRHGGRIWAESVVDQGATFYFTLQGE